MEDRCYQWLARPTPKLYIPLEIPEGQDWREAEWRERLIVGHSVGFDRSFIKEQYYIKVRLLNSFLHQDGKWRVIAVYPFCQRHDAQGVATI